MRVRRRGGLVLCGLLWMSLAAPGRAQSLPMDSPATQPAAPATRPAAPATRPAQPHTQPSWRKVTMADGRVYVGHVAQSAGALVIRTEAKHIYVNVADVKTNEAVGYEPPPTYLFHQDLVGGQKKGTVAGVVRNVRWGRIDPMGKVSVALTDPKLGEVSYTLAVTRITPTLVRLEGVEYQHTWSFPHAAFGRLARQLVLSRVNRSNAASLARAARFFAHAGSFSTADDYLRQFRAAGGAGERAEALAEEFQALRLRRVLDEATFAQAARNFARARTYVNRLGYPAGTRTRYPALADRADARAAALAGEISAMYRASELLADRKIPAEGLIVDQAVRLLAVLDQAGVEPDQIATKHLPLLARPWSTALVGRRITEEILTQAAGLAEQTAEFFAGRGAAVDLAGEFERSTLPMEVKLAIFRYARRLPEPEGPPQWHRAEFRHPRSNKAYHYYLQRPGTYHRRRPTPVLIALHGQLSQAKDVQRAWGDLANTCGMILLSPEYIYGRTWGYKFSVEEHEAVLGALWHASERYNIDTDRVYLQGSSQGGHACWDIGLTHAGRFAGLVPVIGAPMMKLAFPNTHDTAVFSIDGSLDAGAPGLIRTWAAAVLKAGCDGTYVEWKDRGHESFVEEYPAAGRWMLRRRRQPPERVNLVAFRPCELRRRWARVTRPAKPLGESLVQRAVTAAKVVGRCRNNVFTVTTHNVARLEILLPAALIDFRRPIVVTVNGRRRLRKIVRPDWRFALEDSAGRRDRQDVYLGRVPIALDL